MSSKENLVMTVMGTVLQQGLHDQWGATNNGHSTAKGTA